jgi:aminodeoxyfutalosine synthase
VDAYQARVEGMTAISVAEAHELLQTPHLIEVGARGDDERRRRHGTRTTFVRVFDVNVAAVPEVLPANTSAGEIRLSGKPESAEQAIEGVTRARTWAHTIPLTAFSLPDLFELSARSMPRLRALLQQLSAAGLETLAEMPVDATEDGPALVAVAREAGLAVPRLTVRGSVDGPLPHDAALRLIAQAQEIQTTVGGVKAFAPLPRISSIGQPSTGYDDIKQIAVARLLLDSIDTIQVDWSIYGPKLAQVALTVGADDVDGVSPFEGDLGRRRSPIEEIRGNITAAGLEPVERTGAW